MSDDLSPTEPRPSSRSKLTLFLCAILHAFTHAFGTLLVPLYLLIVADLKLGGVKAASLIVTIYGLVYCLGSYLAGVMADRFDRRTLLGIGLIGNAAAILAMGLTRRYEVLLALAVVAGLAGTFFHPAASALVPAHFPKNPGLAIGILGMGAGLGFFAGPQFAGWRAEEGTMLYAHGRSVRVPDWQKPLREMGVAGLAVGVVFLLVAKEAGRGKVRVVFPPAGAQLRERVVIGYESAQTAEHPPLGGAMRRRVIAVASVLACRDFAGVACITLASIYLQKAHGLSARDTGFMLGSMMLLSVVINPIAVWLSSGRRRLPALAVVLISGGIAIAAVPFVTLKYTLAVLCLFQTFQLSSYAISDAAMLERVSANTRGRVVGLFLTIAGTFASTGPWVMGWWTDQFGGHGAEPRAYVGPFATLGLMMIAATGVTPLIARLGKADQQAIEPITEISPRTLEVVG